MQQPLSVEEVVDLCHECMQSHDRPRRLRLLRSLLGAEPRNAPEIQALHPHIWPGKAGERALFRDLHAVGATSENTGHEKQGTRGWGGWSLPGVKMTAHFSLHHVNGPTLRTWSPVEIDGETLAAVICECGQTHPASPDAHGNVLLLKCSACGYRNGVVLDGWADLMQTKEEGRGVVPPAVAQPKVMMTPKMQPKEPAKKTPSNRPDEPLHGNTWRMRTGEGALYITVNRGPDGKPFELFLHGDKAGGCEVAKLEAIARLASLALQRGVDVHEIQEQLAGIRCSKQFGVGPKAVLSCADAVAKALAMDLEGDDDE